MVFGMPALPVGFPLVFIRFPCPSFAFFLRRLSLIELLSAKDPEFLRTLAFGRDYVINKDNSLRGSAAVHAKGRHNSPQVTEQQSQPKEPRWPAQGHPAQQCRAWAGALSAFLCKHCPLQWGLHLETEHDNCHD